MNLLTTWVGLTFFKSMFITSTMFFCTAEVRRDMKSVISGTSTCLIRSVVTLTLVQFKKKILVRNEHTENNQVHALRNFWLQTYNLEFVPSSCLQLSNKLPTELKTYNPFVTTQNLGRVWEKKKVIPRMSLMTLLWYSIPRLWPSDCSRHPAIKPCALHSVGEHIQNRTFMIQ